MGEKEEESGHAKESEDIFGEDLITLSQVLKLDKVLSEKLTKAFQDKAAEIGAKSKQSAKEIRWLSDYCANHRYLIEDKASRRASLSAGSNKNLFEVPDEAGTDEKDASSEIKPPAIKLNELVKRPEMFDGQKPPARKWIDDYEKAAEVNGWNDKLKVRYFSTFLDRSANDWFVGIAKEKLDDDSSWSDLKSIFIRYYLGDSDKMVLRRQINQTMQGERERATTFIPRLVRLVRLVEPQKPEEELVELIRSKLRIAYQDKLTLVDTYTIEQLNDACLKIEASLNAKEKRDQPTTNSAARKSSRNRNREEKDTNSRKSNSHEKTSEPKKGRRRYPPRHCYRCERTGHYANECKYKNKANGEVCNPKVEKNMR